jgi:AcrR family transcriptional regulator
VRTPWGDSSSLRERRLAPGRGTPRQTVEQNQRERLYGAMVACVAEKGYGETSIEDLTRVSGVSSRSFYELFDDKEACFGETLEEIVRSFQGKVLAAGAGDGAGGPIELARLGMVRLADEVVVQPAAARVWLVDAFCSGEKARGRIDRSIGEMAMALGRLFDQLPEREGMPEPLRRALLGGIAGILYRRLAAGELKEIGAIAGELFEWALSIPPPPRPLRVRGRRGREGGNGSPPFAAHVAGERILRGFCAAVAEKGYAAATIVDIAAAASISQSTFYAHFRDKEDALFAALDSSGAQMAAAVLPSIRRSPEWPKAVRVALETICAFLVAEPDFAHLRQVEVYCVGPDAVAKRDEAGAEIIGMVAGLAEPDSLPDPLIVEVTLTAIASLLYEAVRAKPRALNQVVPLGTYLALAPLVGAEEAAVVATE